MVESLLASIAAFWPLELWSSRVFVIVDEGNAADLDFCQSLPYDFVRCIFIRPVSFGDHVGSTVFRSCALALGPSWRRARRCRRGALPPRRCCFVLGSRPYRPGVGYRVFWARRLGGGRAVASHERPARMRERRAPEGPLHAIDATSSS